MENDESKTLSKSQPEKVSNKLAFAIMKKQLKAYAKADKAGKGEILDALESVLHRPRKSIIHSMRRMLGYRSNNKVLRRKTATRVPEKLKKKRGRPYKYPREVDVALYFVWRAYNCPCAERLHPEIKEAIRIFLRDREWNYSQKATNLLAEMSLGSMKRRLVKYAHDDGLMRGFSTTRSGELLDKIPIFHGDWSTKGIGYGQIDTVVHSGSRLEGTMAYTVTFVDMATYWVSLRAQLGKDAKTTKQSIITIEKNLPFPLRGLHPDSGDEFINWTLIAWCESKNKTRKHQIELTRSRPSKKNDNCNVEERNNEVVRKYIGYERYDCKEAITVTNELYHYLELYINFFQPTFKLIKKYRKPNGQWIRKYDEPRAPFRRVLEQSNIPNLTKKMLLDQYNRLNPKHLLDRIEALTTKLRKVQRDQGYHY